MNIKKMEKEVLENSLLLDKKMKSFCVTSNKDKYIVFNQGEHKIVNTLKEGLEIGIKDFGKETGFVIKEISKTIPVFSSLIKL